MAVMGQREPKIGANELGATQEPAKEQAREVLPAHIRVLANGTQKDMRTGKFVPGVRPTSAIMTSERGSELARLRHERAQAAARIALAEAAEERGVQRSSVAAVGLLARKAYDAAHSGFEGDLVVNPDGSEYYKVDRRGAVLAGKMALQLAGMEPAEQRQQAPAVAIQVNIGRELLEQAGIVEGEAREEEG